MTYWNHTTRGGQSRQTHRRFARRQDAVSSPLCPCSVAATLPAAKGTSTNSGAHPSRSPIEGQDGREAKTGVREHPGHVGRKIEGESWGRDSPKDVQLGPRTVPRAPSTRWPLAVRSSSGLSGASSQILCLFTSRRLVATGHRARASAPSFRVKTLRRLLK